MLAITKAKEQQQGIEERAVSLMIGKADTRSLRPTSALKRARGRFTVVGMTVVVDEIGDWDLGDAKTMALGLRPWSETKI